MIRLISYKLILRSYWDVKLKIIESEKPNTKVIQFKLNKKLAKEAYELIVSDLGIQIIASDNAGWFYGVQSFNPIVSRTYRFKEECLFFPSTCSNNQGCSSIFMEGIYAR